MGWPSLLRVHRAELVDDLDNWVTVGMAAAITFPSRVPPRSGLFGRRAGRLGLTLRLRNGYRMKCRLDELEGYYAAFVMRDYADAVEDWTCVDSVIDVGANVGAATLWFARSAPAARILAIEPSPDVFPRLVLNLRLSGLQERVSPLLAAIGGGVGVASVHTEAWSVVTHTEAGIGRLHPLVGQVDLNQLTELFNPGPASVLKLDCEGAEYDALTGASDAALRRFQAIVAEYHFRPGRDVSELQRRLESAGFSLRLKPKDDRFGLIVARREAR